MGARAVCSNLTGTQVSLWRTLPTDRVVAASYGGGTLEAEGVGIPAYADELASGASLPWTVGDWKAARTVRPRSLPAMRAGMGMAHDAVDDALPGGRARVVGTVVSVSRSVRWRRPD